MRKWLTAIPFLFLGFLTWAQAAPPTTTNPKVVPSAVVQQKVVRLTSQVHWHADLEEAKKVAREEKKAIFWLHALGDLGGDC